MKKQDEKTKNTNNTSKKRASPAALYKIHLKNAEDVRRLLSSTINELRQGTIDTGRAGKIIYAASVLLSVFETVNIEGRLGRIEEKMKGRL